MVRTQRQANRNPEERGVFLVGLAVAAVFLFGAAALAIDAGRVFINQNEAQTFADSAALAAAQQLDGTRKGILAARAAAEANRNRWDFGSQDFQPPLVEFARPDAPYAWDRDPSNPALFTRVRVTVRLQQKLWFAPLAGDPLRRSIGAAGIAAAEQTPVYKYHQGVWPYAALESALTPGRTYPLNAWWGSGAPASRVLSDLQMPGETVAMGEPLPSPGEPGGEAPALVAARVAQDADVTSATYAEYLSAGQGNGRRIVLMPIHDGAVVKAFGMFFLPPAGGAVEYVGKAYLPNAAHPGAGAPGGYEVRLTGALP